MGAATHRRLLCDVPKRLIRCDTHYRSILAFQCEARAVTDIAERHSRACKGVVTAVTAVQIAFSQLVLLHLQLCRACFFEVFEDEVHQTIIANRLFKAGEKVAIGASGTCIPVAIVLQSCCMHTDHLIDINDSPASTGTPIHTGC